VNSFFLGVIALSFTVVAVVQVRQEARIWRIERAAEKFCEDIEENQVDAARALGEILK
jgi:hypothetical protein